MNSYVLITGAAGGLGKAFAMECASRGWNVFLTDIREVSLKVLAAGLERMYGISVVFKECDLTVDESRSELFDFIEKNGITFHFLINVAGLDYEGTLNERSTRELDAIVRLNVNATYAATKRFILDFSLAVGEELKGKDASVTVLCPGGMPTREDVIESIESQGFVGRATTKNVGWVASKTIDSALRGKKVFIPGIFNVLLRIVGGFIPTGIITKMIAKRWNYTRSLLADQK